MSIMTNKSIDGNFEEDPSWMSSSRPVALTPEKLDNQALIYLPFYEKKSTLLSLFNLEQIK